MRSKDEDQRDARARAPGASGLGRRDVLKAGTLALTGLVALNEVRTAKADAEDLPGVPKWGMVIDLRRCIGCRACTVACKTEFSVPVGVFRCVVKQKDSGTYPKARRSFLPLLCNHCGSQQQLPPCVEVCPSDEGESTYISPSGEEIRYRHKASHKKPDGTVHADPELCIGCEACIAECPYGVRYMDPSRKSKVEPELFVAAKCTFCYHRIIHGIAPACVNTCVGRARIFGDLSDPKSEVAKLLKANKTSVLLPEEGTNPNVYYIDLEQGVYEKGGEFRDQV